MARWVWETAKKNGPLRGGETIKKYFFFIFFFICCPGKKKYILLKMTYRNIHIQVYTLSFHVSQQSRYLLTGLLKYGSLSPTIVREEKMIKIRFRLV